MERASGNLADVRPHHWKVLRTKVRKCAIGFLAEPSRARRLQRGAEHDSSYAGDRGPALVVVGSLQVWFSLAKANEKAEESDGLAEKLLRLAAELAATSPQIVAQNDTTHRMLLNIQMLVQQRAAILRVG
jgi:hypothetical protein